MPRLATSFDSAAICQKHPKLAANAQEKCSFLHPGPGDCDCLKISLVFMGNLGQIHAAGELLSHEIGLIYRHSRVILDFPKAGFSVNFEG
jgi:hypothetical protein